MRKVSIALALLFAFALALIPSVSVAQNAYVANQANNTIAVVNTATNTLCTTSTCRSGATYPIPVGTTPSVVAVTPNNKQVYVLNSGSGSVSVISTATDTVTATISMPQAIDLAISPDGTKVYVSADNTGPTLSVINTSTNTVTTTFSASGLYGLTFSPDGTTLYGAAFAFTTGATYAVDTASNSSAMYGCSTIGEYTTLPLLNGLFYEVSQVVPTYVFICGATGTTSTITLGNAMYGSFDGNLHPWALSPDGTRVYTTGAEIQSINVASSSVGPTISTPTSALAFMPRGNTLYTVNASTVAVINASTNTVTTTIPISGGNLAAIGIQPPDWYQFGKDLGPRDCGCNGAQSGSLTGNDGSVSAGEPIDVGSGNVAYQVTDYKTTGQNPLSFARYYNSLASANAISTFATTLGPSWRSNYDRYIQILSSSQVVAERTGGQQLTFTLNGSTWTSDSDVDVTLTHSGSTWTLTDHDDTVEAYTTASTTEALLNSIKARNGYTQVLNYNGSNQLTSVTDSYSRSLTLAYSGGLLETVTTPDSTTLTYGYTSVSGGSRLTTITYSTSPATSQTYLYANSALPFALTGITDENGNSFASWTYDGFGRGLTSQLGSGANLTTIAYNFDNSRTVTNPLGVVDTYSFNVQQGIPKATQISRAATSTTAAATETTTYDANGYRASFTDWNGNQTTYTNNSHGMPTTINEAVGSSVARTTTITYDPTWVHLPHTVTTPGLTTSFTYDGSGETLTTTLTDTTTQTVPYSTNGQTRTTTNTWSSSLLASVKTPNGNTTTFGYSSSGALTSVTDALSHATHITAYTGGGLPETIVDPNGVTTTLTYSPRQWLTSSVISGTGGTFTTSWSYDAAGNLLKKTLPDSSYLLNTYDTAHRVTKVTDALGDYANYSLDALGDVTAYAYYASTGGAYKTHSDSYDALGRLLVDTGGRSQTVTYGYDPDGNLLTVKDGNSHTTTNVYDALNRRKSSTDANSGVAAYTFDAHDRTLTVSDKDSNVTSYVYDGPGDLIQQASPDTGTTVYHYDGDQNLTQKTDAAGVIMYAQYDTLDRNINRTYPADSSQDVWKTYDQSGGQYGFGIGRLTTVSDAAGCCYALGYDERGNVNFTQRTIGSSYSTTYPVYDAAGRLSGMTYPSGIFVGYARDAMGRINQAFVVPAGASSGQTVAWMGNVPFGPMNYITYGNGVTGPYQLDPDYSIYNMQQTTSGGTTLQNLTYALDNNNNVSSITDSVNAANSQTLGYDIIDRLTSAISGTGGYGSLAWTYTKNGNMLTNGSSSYVATYTPGTNRIATYDFPGTNSTYHYTATGNLSSVTVGSGSYDTATYNVANRLASLTNISLAYSNVYDYVGRRFSKTDAGYSPNYYTYDLAGNLIEENDGGTVTDYIYVNGRPIGTFVPVSGGTSGTMYYVHTDRLGTPQFATNSSQSIVWSKMYTPFGDTAAPTGTITQNLRFPGQYNDHEGAYAYNLNRDYLLGFGRYIEADRIGLAGGLNPYVYANANPFKFTDRLGLQESENDNKSEEDVEEDIFGPILREPSTSESESEPEPETEQTAEGNSYSPTQQCTQQFPVGRSGNPLIVRQYNTPGSVNVLNYKGHAFDEMQSEGIPPSVVENTLNNSEPQVGKYPGTAAFYDHVNNITVIINSSGSVITVSRGEINQ